MWRWWKEHKRELIATPMAGVSRAQQIDPFPRWDWTSTADIQPHNRGRTAMRSQECAADESELFELVPSCSSGVPASRFNWTFSILPQGKMSTVFLHVHRVRPKVASAVAEGIQFQMNEISTSTMLALTRHLSSVSRASLTRSLQRNSGSTSNISTLHPLRSCSGTYPTRRT